MGHEGPYLQIRPLAGGREWDADPGHLRLLTQDELLRALVAEANARSRQGIWRRGGPPSTESRRRPPRDPRADHPG
ncbi:MULTISPECIES: hypothetical protein [unclassified Streptomyces]|uniref:Uncharacterized protein n=1 Tax=Streptomyces sp. NBC_00119 TaxID=2975659 RepID=A0AAU1UN78_9ACTN|nr:MULTISPECIES: hypothetical protein [unclassified Streptomyces]MCX4642585.1 hypothetical protein [Streptomyces sp. NBC_01446]MCX5327526.1 hypothetical protein [Streptomyces sp. NBC_00120]